MLLEFKLKRMKHHFPGQFKEELIEHEANKDYHL